MEQGSAKSLGGRALAALIIANIIGTGVFTTSGFSVGAMGSREAVLLAWCVGGIHALLGALSYIWLVQRYPHSGGEYLLLSRALHPAAGYVAGWVSLLAGFTAPIAAAAHGLEAYAGFGGSRWLGASVIVACALLHGIFARGGVIFQNLAVFLKMILLFLFVGWGLWGISIRPDMSSLANARWENFGSTCVWITFSYTGWNAAVYVADEIKDIQKDLVRATLGAVLVVMALYLCLNAVFLYAAPLQQLSNRPDVGVFAASALGGAGASHFLSGVVVLALVTSISSMSMAGPRVTWQMARDGYLPAIFGKGEPPPTLAIFLQAALALLVFWVSSLKEILGMIGLTLILSSAGTVAALFVEQYRTGWRPKSSLYPMIPALFWLMTLAMGGWMAWRAPKEALISVGVLVLGGVGYMVQGRKGQDSR
ncbi:MAG: amino acid permease [Myxococcales bacterium]|nr:amino acid permease [Myxococcales bacterium]